PGAQLALDDESCPFILDGILMLQLGAQTVQRATCGREAHPGSEPSHALESTALPAVEPPWIEDARGSPGIGHDQSVGTDEPGRCDALDRVRGSVDHERPANDIGV